MFSFIRSFVRSFVRLFVHSFIELNVYLYTCWVRAFIGLQRPVRDGLIKPNFMAVCNGQLNDSMTSNYKGNALWFLNGQHHSFFNFCKTSKVIKINRRKVKLFNNVKVTLEKVKIFIKQTCKAQSLVTFACIVKKSKLSVDSTHGHNHPLFWIGLHSLYFCT